MPSLKLSNPFRRGADRPSLKQRAASLKASAARVMKRRSVNAAPVTPTADPVFPVLARYQAARTAWDAFSDRIENEGWDALGGSQAVHDEEGRLGHAWSNLSTEVLATVPTTEAGRLALADFVATWVDSHGNADGSPQDGSETVFAEVYPALLRTVRSLGAGASAKTPRIADGLDLATADMRTLAAIHDAAGLICGVADAVSCQPRCYTPQNERWNAVGLFADAISDECGAVLADAVREARKRVPSDDWERGLRLGILAQDTIENGDKGAVSALARDLQAIG